MNDLMKTPKITPRIQSTLKHTVEVPEVMYKASGINVNGRRIKSLLFSTDVALIANNNADAILLHLLFRSPMRLLVSLDNQSL